MNDRQARFLCSSVIFSALLFAGCATNKQPPPGGMVSPTLGSAGTETVPPAAAAQAHDMPPVPASSSLSSSSLGAPDVSSYARTGRASWYAARFVGRRTASGERYDAHALTAAHRTLPLLSYVRVTNPANGKSVVVKINDRGPYHRGRLIDLSAAAARALGLRHAGTGRVEVRGLSALQAQDALQKQNGGSEALASD